MDVLRKPWKELIGVDAAPDVRRGLYKSPKMLFARLELELDPSHAKRRPADVEVDENGLRVAIMSAMRSMHGETGLAIPIEILKYDSSQRMAVIQFSSRHYLSIRGALACSGIFREEIYCSFRFHEVSLSLESIKIELQDGDMSKSEDVVDRI